MLLMTLRVRDLRWYLEQKEHVSVSHCKEKSELVDLVLQRNGYRVPSYGAGVAPVSSYRTSRPDESPQQSSGTGATPQNRSSSSLADEWIFVNDDGATEAQTPTTANPSAKVTQETCDSEFKALNIDSVDSEEQIRQLSARQLKLILARNFVDFKGCCEREELMQKVLRLWREKKEAQKMSLEDISDENLCKICMEQAIDCVLLECGHMISCVACGKRLAECPICRQYVVRAVRIFKS